MAKAAPFLSSSNAGEFSPRMDARVDFEKYQAAISRGLNLVCLPQGGVTRRPGTRFVKEIKSSTSEAYLIPFDPVSDQAYMIEAGNTYLRFYRNQGRLAVEETAAAFPNGTFASDITGWTDLSTGDASISWSSSGVMDLTGDASGLAWAEEQISITATSQVHVIAFQIGGLDDAKVTVQIGTSTGASDVLKYTNLGPGWHVVGFTPGAANIYFQVINEQADVATLDNVRFLSDEPLELTTEYTAAQASELRWAQSADVMYLFHGDVQPYKLERRGDLSWSLVRVFFADGPWLGLNPDTDLDQVQLIENPRFDGGMQGWSANSTGNGWVEYSPDSKAVVFRSFADGAATGSLSQTVATPLSASKHVMHFQTIGGGSGDTSGSYGSGATGGAVTLSIGTTAGDDDILASGALSAGWHTVEFTPGVDTFYITFSSSSTGAAVSSGVTAAFCYTTNARLLEPSGTSGSVTLTALGDFKPFASTDVGRHVRLEYAGREPAYGVITAYSTSQSVTLWLYKKIQTAAPCESWRMGAWSDTTGFPKVGTFYQQRLFCASSDLRPQTVWASQSGDFENMQPDSWVTAAKTVEDDDALDFTIASGVAAPIVWLFGSRRLVIGTTNGQWSASSRGAVLTPSDFAADPQTSVRALDAMPVQIDTVGLFIQRAKRSIYDIGYAFEIDSFKAADVTILADHITSGNVAQIVYQAEPYSNVWARLENGRLACLTYKRGHNVVGWTPIAIGRSSATAARVESIAVIPGADDDGQVYSSENRDELWMIVRRTINGSVKRYIEVMEGYFDGPNRAEYLSKANFREAVKEQQIDAFYVDCGATYDGAATTTITGLDHLEGEAVVVLADGAQVEGLTVSGGEIELPAAASKVHVGLGYDWLYRGMKLPFGSPTGAGVGQTKVVNGLVLVLRDCAEFEYAIEMVGEGDDDNGPPNFQDIAFRLPSDAMDEAVPLFTGEVVLDTEGGLNTDPRLIMRAENSALPWTLLGITPRVAESEL